MRNRGGEFSFFQEIHIRIDISSDISSSKRPMTTQPSNETTQAGADDVVNLLSPLPQCLLPPNLAGW